jgi:DNA-binding MarR family transcriptional regulator
VADDTTTSRRKTSFSLTPAAAKALARAKFELYADYDLQVSQSDLLEVLIQRHTRNIGELADLLREKDGTVTP